MRCLEVEIPKCIQNAPRQPPVCWPKIADVEVLDRITAFGERFGRGKNEIMQACNLAAGLSDIVVVLKRPHERQNYSDPFEDFVRNCTTLANVDELIRFGSKGARSIHTVTVLDAFSFQPIPGYGVPSNDCNQLLEEVLKVKRPKVVLCCWSDSEKHQCTNGFVSQFKSLGVGKGEQLVQINWDDARGGQTTAIRSFHPGYLHYEPADRKIHARFLISYHFALAFALLAGETQQPTWLGPLCQNSARNASEATQFSTRDPDPFPIVIMIRNMLRRILLGKPGSNTVPQNIRKDRLEIDERIKELFSSPPTDKGWEMAELVVWWGRYDHPEKLQILDRLEEVRDEQVNLIPTPLGVNNGLADRGGGGSPGENLWRGLGGMTI